MNAPVPEAPAPPPLPNPARQPLGRAKKLLILLGILGVLMVVLPLLLMATGRLRAFKIPTRGMAPTLESGDQILMNGFTPGARSPHRGDVVVFRTDGIERINGSSIYTQRVVGEPGEHLQISRKGLLINGELVKISNVAGEIPYQISLELGPSVNFKNVEIPEGHYFVIGDNVANSFDSRFWGFLPAENILGRASFCYAPPSRVGSIK